MLPYEPKIVHRAHALGHFLDSNSGEKVRVTSVEDGHNTVSQIQVKERKGVMHGQNAVQCADVLLLVAGIVLNLPNAEELTGSSTKSDVGALVVVNGSLGKHGVVLDLGLAKRRSVGRDQNKLGLAGAHVLKSALKTESNLTRLDHELELGVDVVLRRLLSLGCHDSVRVKSGGVCVWWMVWMGERLKEKASSKYHV